MNKYLLGITLCIASISANAALFDRGGGMIYDDVQNITWLQDANYSETSGYDTDGYMTQTEAKAWANGLVYGGYSDWRLSSAGLIGSTLGTYDGSTDRSYNNTRSELGHLFLELGNKAEYTTAGVPQVGYGFSHSTFIDPSDSTLKSFLNTQNYVYWEDEVSSSSEGYVFDARFGLQRQDGVSATSHYNAWAVRDGDVSAVPVPATVWLFPSALGLLGLRRRKA